ncbi:putative General transcription factor 3C Polypeptide 1, partial [Daphnia magna]
EGLEGLSISSLWIRLTKRKNFPIALDDQSKRFIWKIICKNDAVEMFKLAELKRTSQLRHSVEAKFSQLFNLQFIVASLLIK